MILEGDLEVVSVDSSISTESSKSDTTDPSRVWRPEFSRDMEPEGCTPPMSVFGDVDWVKEEDFWENLKSYGTRNLRRDEWDWKEELGVTEKE